MRRFWYLKYLVTLLASTAITFHILHSKIAANVRTFSPIVKSNQPSFSSGLSDSKSLLMRKLSERHNTTISHQLNIVQPAWTVLSGNITVHEGQENVPLEFSFGINPMKICDTFDSSKKSLLIFVATSANHFSQRNVIRETWGLKLLQDAYNYKVVFLLGEGDDETQESIVYEGYRYGDLVQINLTESFRNLGRKSVAGLLWSKTYCGRADFVMKTDDDILLHVPNLRLAIDSATNPDSLLLCHENRMRKILRKKLLDAVVLPASYYKYEVSENELPGTYYPPYCSGMAYAFSNAVRDRLLKACQITPVFFIEDVYLTGFCRHKAGITITPHVGVTLRPPISEKQAACVFRDGRITSQEVGADELRKLWAELNTQGFFCPELLGLRPKKVS